MTNKQTDVHEFIGDLDGGVFEEKVSRAISDVAGAVIDHSEKGKISIELEFSQIGNSGQVMIKHKLYYSRPTSKGKIGEENTTKTPMYVGPKGKVTLFPEGQAQMFTKKGEVNQPE